MLIDNENSRAVAYFFFVLCISCIVTGLTAMPLVLTILFFAAVNVGEALGRGKDILGRSSVQKANRFKNAAPENYLPGTQLIAVLKASSFYCYEIEEKEKGMPTRLFVETLIIFTSFFIGHAFSRVLVGILRPDIYSLFEKNTESIVNVIVIYYGLVYAAILSFYYKHTIMRKLEEEAVAYFSDEETYKGILV